MPSAPERKGVSPVGEGTVRAALIGAVAATLVLAAGCARQEAPPGAVPESQPPRIAELFPARDTVIEGLGDAARVEFDEPISARGNLSRQLRASPAFEYRVEAGHGDIRVEPRDGWRPGAVYVLELDVGVSDLLNNAREEPIRWRFSTGPPVSGTVVTGRIWDRITGEQIQEARAVFLALGGDSALAADSIPYSAVPDSGGTFRLEAVPPGSYRAYGFRDRNRNRTLDRRLEASDSTTFTLDGPAGTAALQFVLVEPDSTPPVLGLAEARDSLTLRLTFDDYLLPGGAPLADSVILRRAGEEEAWPVDSLRVLEADEVEGREALGEDAFFDPSEVRQAGQAPADTTAPGDTAGAAPETAARPDTAAAGQDTAAARDTGAAEPDTAVAAQDTAPASPVGPLPSRSLQVRLGRPLTPDTFRVMIRGVRNLQGLAGGGDTLFVYTPAPDTAAAPPDTATALSDTAGASPDTAAPDTATASADTTRRSPLRREDP